MRIRCSRGRRAVSYTHLDVYKRQIVYGVRKERKTDTFFKRTTAQAFYKLMNMMGVKTVYNHADFRLMSKRAVEEFSKYQMCIRDSGRGGRTAGE